MFSLSGYGVKIRAPREDDEGVSGLSADDRAWCIAVEGEDMAACVVLILDQRTGQRVFEEGSCGAEALDKYEAAAWAARDALEAEQTARVG